MKIADISKELNIPVVRINSLVKRLFGTDLLELSDPQYKQLVEALKNASTLAEQPKQQRVLNSSYSQYKPILDDVGIKQLKTNSELIDKIFILYFSELKNQIDKDVDSATSALTQYAYSKIASSQIQIAKNVLAIKQEFDSTSFNSCLNSMISGSSVNLSKEEIELLEIELSVL